MATTLYNGIAFSPQTTLADNIGEADTIIKVEDSDVFPPAPNLATIGTDEEGETILYTAKAEGMLSGCQRGVEGTARAWQSGELIGRNFTAKDHDDMITAVKAAQSAANTAQTTATRAVTDAATAQTTANGRLPLTGGTMTGVINREGGQYATIIKANSGKFYFQKDGEGSSLAMASTDLDVLPENSVNVSGIATPVFGTDIANKTYVDTQTRNRNLLDNWHFANPINQRGWTAYSYSTHLYSIDRWQIYNGVNLSLENGYIRLQNTEYDYGEIKQVLEAERIPQSGYCTMSILYRGGPVRVYSRFNGRESIEGGDWCPESSDWSVTSTSFEIPAQDNTLLDVMLGVLRNKYIDLKAIKFELGLVQTLAHKEGSTWVLNDPPPDMALELAKCQRYQYFTRFNGTSSVIIGSDVYILINLPVTMRTVPQLVGTPIVRNVSGNAVNPGTVSVTTIYDHTVELKVTGAGQNVYVYSEHNGHVGFDANL